MPAAAAAVSKVKPWGAGGGSLARVALPGAPE
jgi:hypothetical protein